MVRIINVDVWWDTHMNLYCEDKSEKEKCELDWNAMTSTVNSEHARLCNMGMHVCANKLKRSNKRPNRDPIKEIAPLSIADKHFVMVPRKLPADHWQLREMAKIILWFSMFLVINFITKEKVRKDLFTCVSFTSYMMYNWRKGSRVFPSRWSKIPGVYPARCTTGSDLV